MPDKNTLEYALTQTLSAYNNLKDNSVVHEVEFNFRVYTIFYGKRSDVFELTELPKEIFYKAYKKLRTQRKIWPTAINDRDCFVLKSEPSPNCPFNRNCGEVAS